MANIEITNNDVVGFVLWEPVYDDATLTASGAVTWAVGTLLGRITASGKLTAYTSGASDGSEVPKFVLPIQVVFTGAGDAPGRVLIGGRVRRADLVAHGVGAITLAEADQLRDYGIVSLTTQELSDLDNQ